MKSGMFLFIAEFIYRLRTLFHGAINVNALEKMMEKEICSDGQKSFWHRLMKQAYKRELIAYATALDTWAMREIDDPFIHSPIIERYEKEFKEFAKEQTYQPGGMINTELLVLYCLIRHSKPEVFIESGTMNAYSSVFIAEALRQNNCQL